jgi:hypothetical protein
LLIAQSQVEKMTLAAEDSAFVGVASAKADAVRTALPNRYEIDRLESRWVLMILVLLVVGSDDSLAVAERLP